MEGQSHSAPLLLLRNLVAHGESESIPTTSGVGEIKRLVKIHIEIRFSNDAEITIVVGFPQVFAVIRRSRRTMHTNSGHGIETAEIIQMLTESLYRFSHITVLQRKVFIMISYLMLQGCDMADDVRLITLRHNAEIIRGTNAQTILNLRKAQTVLRFGIHIMTQDDKTPLSTLLFRHAAIVLESNKLIACALQRHQKRFIS